MGKKIAALLLVVLLTGGGAALAMEGEAGSTFTPGDAFYNAFLDLKTSQCDLTEDLLEKALLLDELADQLVDAIMSESDMNYLDELIEQLSLTEADIVDLIAAYYESNGDPDGEDPDGEDPGEDEFGCSQRGRRLREKVADEFLPEHVRANAQKALDNQARAMEHHAWAQSGQQGPPPWANSRHNRENPDGDENPESTDPNEDENPENPDPDGNDNSENLEQGSDGKNLTIQGEKHAKVHKEKNKNKNGKPGRGWGRAHAPGQQKKK